MDMLAVLLCSVSRLYYVDGLAVLFSSVCPGYITCNGWLYCSVVCVQVILGGCVGCIVM